MLENCPANVSPEVDDSKPLQLTLLCDGQRIILANINNKLVITLLSKVDSVKTIPASQIITIETSAINTNDYNACEQSSAPAQINASGHIDLADLPCCNMSTKCLGITTEGVISLLRNHSSEEMHICNYSLIERRATWYKLTPKTSVPEKS